MEQKKFEIKSIEEVSEKIQYGDLSEELLNLEKIPIICNIKEYGINENELSLEQLESLKTIRNFLKEKTKKYRVAMHLLMTSYQQKNPNFTDAIVKKMIEGGYDVPDFSIYDSKTAKDFLLETGLTIDDPELKNNFLINFQLPKPLARFWYKDNIKPDDNINQIQWGLFYKMTMPIIQDEMENWHYLNLPKKFIQFVRLNGSGDHDPKKYYYLYKTQIGTVIN